MPGTTLPVHRDPDWLRRKYWDEGMTLDEVAGAAGVSAYAVVFQMDKYGIERRNSRGRPPIPEADLLADIRGLARKLGRPPNRSEYVVFGEHSLGTIRRRFGSWSEGRREALGETGHS